MTEKSVWKIFDMYNYLCGYIRYRWCPIREKLFGNGNWTKIRYCAGKRLISRVETNRQIGEALQKGNAYWAGRIGDTEMKAVYAVLAHRMDESKDDRVAATNQMCNNAGFFPNDVALCERFADEMLTACKNIDIQGQWARYMEDYLYVKYQKKTVLSHIEYLEPWSMYLCPKSKVKPWSAMLKGKRVLVIHPFADTIYRQYTENRTKIFENIFDADDILPEFELKTLKAVQTIAGTRDERFENWFEALNWMIEECEKIDFDVAIIGCGAYGYLLADRIKKMEKIAIHLGGATQLLFGIIGKRWEEDNPQFCKMVVNEYWTRPAEHEKVDNLKKIENGCYW